MEKILYIRLDSSPKPAASPNLIIKDVNTETYFYSFLGKRIQESAGITNGTMFSGEIIAGYVANDKEAYEKLACEWKAILIELLSNTTKINKPYKVDLSSTFVKWLCYHEKEVYREIGSHLHSTRISFMAEDIYTNIIDKVLLMQLKFFFKKLETPITSVSFSLLLPEKNFLTLQLPLADIKVASPNELKLRTKYESLGAYNGLTRIIDKDTKKFGFVDANMNEVFPCVYDFATDFNTDVAFAHNGKECFLLGKEGSIESLCFMTYMEFPVIDENLIKVKNKPGNGYGLINTKGEEVAPCQYWHIAEFSEGLAIANKFGRGQDWHGVIDKNGNELACLDKYADMYGFSKFSDGLLKVKYNYQYGFIDKNGNEVIPCQYEDAGDFHEGLARVADKEGCETWYGFIDKSGEEIVPCQYCYAGDFHEGMAWVKDEDDLYGFVDKNGDEIIPCQYEDADDFKNGLAMVQVGEDEWVVIDKTGEIVVSKQYLEYYLSDFSEDMLWVQDECELYGYIDKTGKEVIPCQYNGACSFSESLAAVQNEDDLWGFIDKTGKEVIPCQYNDADYFSESLAAVQNEDELWGFIDRTGKEIIPCQYDRAYQISGGLAVVKKNGLWGGVDKTGQIAIPIIFDEVYGFYKEIAIVRKNNKYGIILKKWFEK